VQLFPVGQIRDLLTARCILGNVARVCATSFTVRGMVKSAAVIYATIDSAVTRISVTGTSCCSFC
jgi:hypothetical protein